MTSRRNAPSTRVASVNVVPGSARRPRSRGIGQDEVAQEQAAVRVRVRAHPSLAFGAARAAPARARRRRRRAPRAGSSEPLLELRELLRRRRALPRAAPGASATFPRRAGRRRPSARSSPSAFAGSASASAGARSRLPRAPRLDRAMSSSASPSAAASCRCTSSGSSPRTRRPVAVPLEQRDELVLGNAREHGRVRDLVAVEVEDRQHGAVRTRVEELVRVPARREGPVSASPSPTTQETSRSGLSNAAPYACDERVAELAALVDRSWRLRRDVARDAAGNENWRKSPRRPVHVAADGG